MAVSIFKNANNFIIALYLIIIIIENIIIKFHYPVIDNCWHSLLCRDRVNNPSVKSRATILL